MKQSSSIIVILIRQLSIATLFTLSLRTSFLKTANASHLNHHLNHQQQTNNNRYYSGSSSSSNTVPLLDSNNQIPIITPFHFDQNVQENQRSSVLCEISSGEIPVSISWLKDGQLLTPQIAQAKKINIKPDTDQSQLKFTSVRLEHSGNYTCVAKNRAGIQAHSAQLIVHAEPYWVKEPLIEPIVTTKGQTIVIDCQSNGWPKPQQSWQIKTHLQNEFENLIAPLQNGRISIASNGSLIIKNVDKTDEANYLCKSTNGIGRGISWSTSLKVTIPAHFESPIRQQTNVIRKQNQVQLRCDAYGDEPLTIEWFKNKQRLNNEFDPRFSIHNKPLNNGLISILVIKSAQRQDNSVFECVTRNPVGKDRLPIELLVQEEPDHIEELNIEQINSRSISLNWTEPYDGRSGITNYMFQYKKIQPDQNQNYISDSNLMMSSDNHFVTQSNSDMSSSSSPNNDDWQHATRIVLPVQGNSFSNGNTRLITIEKLEPSTKYVLRAMAINAIGQSKFSQPMEFTTEEEAPESKATNIRAQAINSTSIHVSWDEIPKNKLSKIHGYYIGYRVAATGNFSSSASSSSLSPSSSSYPSYSTTQNNNFVYKPYLINTDLIQQQQSIVQEPTTLLSIQQQTQRLEFIINDLRRDTLYEITILAFNSRGSGPKSDSVLCKTIEMEPPKAVKLQIRNESNDSIFIEWQRDPLDLSPVDDYVLYQEKNSGSQEWLQIRFPGNQTHYKAPGLKCGTRYQFYIIAHNKIGKSPPSDVVGASTSGSLPIIPSKRSLLKLFNSTCLLVNLNSFQDDNCRVRTFTVRYRVEKTALPLLGGHQQQNQNGPLVNDINGISSQHQALTGASNKISSSSSSSLSGVQLDSVAAVGKSGASNSIGATGSALMSASLQRSSSSTSSPSSPLSSDVVGINGAETQTPSGEWITIRPKSNNKHHANEEDRMEYLCGLHPTGEYTIHVAALNDVGRSEIEYTVLMSSDELRYSIVREIGELLSTLPNVFSYIPSMIVFLMAALFLSLAYCILYTTVKKYYQKIIIMHNQMRATRRAKQDEKRRRNLMNSSLSSSTKNSRRLDLWADEFDEDEDEDGEGLNEANINGCDDGDEADADDDNSSSGGTTTSRGSAALMHNNSNHHHHNQLHTLNSHYHKQQQFQQQHNNHLHQRQLSQQTISAAHLHQQQHHQFATTQRRRPNGATRNEGHYISNISDSDFFARPSLEGSPFNASNGGKQCYNGSASMSTASTDSIHGRFQCLNTRQYTKMNEYSMLPSISASLTQARQTVAPTGTITNDIYGTAPTGRPSPQKQPSVVATGTSPINGGLQSAANSSLYYSTLRRSSMQTYLPQQARALAQQQQQQQQLGGPASASANRQGQNIADIYGYYMAPPQINLNDSSAAANHHTLQQQQQQQQQQLGVSNEAANSILVLPQQIIYSAPNIRRQPVFL